MRITENQIRRIIRQTLKKAILTEGKRASNWEEYVEYTVTNNPTLNITEEDVQGMVDDYKNIVSHFNRRLSDPEDDEGLTKETMGNLSWEEGQTDSYKDFVSWYMRFNASSNRNEFYDDGKDDKWIDPAGLVDIFYILSASLAKQNEEAPKEPEENKRWLGRKLAAASDRRKRRRAARKEGREERKDIRKGTVKEIDWLDDNWNTEPEEGVRFPGWTKDDYWDFRKNLQKQLKKGSRYKQREIIKAINAGKLEGEAGVVEFKESEVTEVEAV